MEELLTLVKNQPNKINIKMELAKKYIDSNDFQKAQIVLEEVKNIEPLHLDANYILAQIYEFDENYEKAIDCIEKIIQQQPSINFKYKLAQLYENAENYEKALDCFMQCFEAAPEDSDLLEKIAHVNRILGNNDIAINFYNRLLDNNPNDIVALSQLMELYEQENRFLYYSIRAKIHFIEGALSYAAASYKKAVAEADSDEDIIKTRLALAEIFSMKENYNHAVDEYLAILNLDKNNYLANKNLAEAYYKIENFEAAGEVYSNLLENNPDDIGIMKQLAEIYMELEENNRALTLLEKIISTEPDNYSAYVDFARVNIALSNDSKALESLHYVLEKDSKNVETRGVLVDFYLLKKETEKALSLAEEIKKLIPKSPFGYKKSGEIYENLKKPFESHYNFGLYHDLKGEKQLAIDEFTCALDHEPANIDILIKIAKLYTDIAEDYIALEYYQKAYADDKENLEVLNKMAEIYLKTKDYENAVETYTKILSLNNKNKDLYYIIGELYEKLRNLEKALEYYQTFVETAPLSVKTDEVKAKIEKLNKKLNENDESEGIFEKIFKIFSR